jgi:hypothetical protein
VRGVVTVDPLVLTEEELARLIAASDRDHLLAVTWGSGVLLGTPGNDWARELIREWRSVGTAS